MPNHAESGSDHRELSKFARSMVVGAYQSGNAHVLKESNVGGIKTSPHMQEGFMVTFYQSEWENS